MVINKISQSNNLFIRERDILNFGASFKISYWFIPSQDLPDSLHILYEIRLIENSTELIGVITAEYEFVINPVLNQINSISFENEESIVKDCLKRNHYNIKSLVEDALKENQLNINVNYAKFLN